MLPNREFVPRSVVMERRRSATAALPVIPVHPATPTVPLPSTAHCSPWTAACASSAQPGTAAWAFVTGAGYADHERLSDDVTAEAAEFASYANALALFSDGSKVTLITGSQPGAEALGQIIGHRHTRDRRGIARIARSATMQTVTAIFNHVHRLGSLAVECHPDGSHPLQLVAQMRSIAA